MWDDRFVFVFSALFTIAVWVSRRSVAKSGRTWIPYYHFTAILAVSGVVLIIRYLFLNVETIRHVFFNVGTDVSGTDLLYPNLGTLLSIMLGVLVGLFSARFIWILFGVSFGARNPLIGVLSLLLLVVVYSLPAYQREISHLFEHIGISSLKTPIAELTFAERPRSPIIRAAKPATDVQHSSAVPRPNDPLPGLKEVKLAVSNENEDYLKADSKYINYFDTVSGQPASGSSNREIIDSTGLFLEPVKVLVDCLYTYVTIYPDAELVLVDTKPIIQRLFLEHAEAKKALSLGRDRPDPSYVMDEFGELKKAAEKVRVKVLEAFELTAASSHDVIRGQLGKLLPDRIAITSPSKQDNIKAFVEACGQDLTSINNTAQLRHFSYLQPYLTIAHAGFLVAHGAPDEAVQVMADWLDLWRCARGDTGQLQCPFSRLPSADGLPEWFGIRGEFELNVLLYALVGEFNPAYREFLEEHAKHFSTYVTDPQRYDRQPGRTRVSRAATGISIQDQARRGCAEYGGFSKEDEVPVLMLRSLAGNENTLLRSNLQSLTGLSWAGMENLYERSQLLTQVRSECIDPQGDEWQADMADYKITSGLLGLAIADRMAATAGSADERSQSQKIWDEAKQDLRTGYRRLCRDFREDDRKSIRSKLLAVRVFSTSRWEESCGLAGQAIYQLRESSPQ